MADHPSDDLDHLLDSALDDFSKLDLAPAQRGDAAGSGGRSSGGGEGNRVGGEGQSASPSSSSAPVQGLGMGMGLPDPRQMKKKGRQTNTPGGAPPKGVSHASEALAMLTQQTQQAVLGLESTLGQGQRGGEDLDKEGIVEDFVKQFEEIAGSQDMESIVETMMQQLLSKEILHEPMKEIAERYPKWLEEHRDGLKPEDYDRYHHQYEIIRMLNEVYENDPDNFSKIIELMQKMQECGQPPNDIVQELAPDLDLTNLGQITVSLFCLDLTLKKSHGTNDRRRCWSPHPIVA